jgi:hypothetical protein
MANSKLFNSDFRQTRAAEETGYASSGKRIAALAASLLIITSFAAVGCSKSKEGTRVSTPSSSQPSSSSTVSPVAMTPILAVNEKPVAKKVLKKRPSTVTYKDVASGISFQYPRKYTLKTGEDAKLDWNGLGPVGMNFIEPGGVTVAAVVLPENSYPGTDFASAFFNISVNRSLSAEACGKFGLTDSVHPEEAAAAAKVKIGGKEFEQVEDFGGEAIKQADAKYYHLYENGACYEFALGLGTAGYGVEDGIEPVDRAQVFAKLERILATVKLQPVAEKQITVAKSDQPATKEMSRDAVTDTGTKGMAVEKTADIANKEVTVEKSTTPASATAKSVQASETIPK